MAQIGLALLLGWVLERVLLSICHRNIGTPYNGLGAAPGALARMTDAPMAYRLLLPLLMGLFPERYRAPVYFTGKVLLTAAMVWALIEAWGLPAALLVCAMLPVTFQFDYWDWSVELLGMALAWTGQLPLAIIGAALWGASRETVALAPLGYFLATGDLAGTVIVGWAGLAPWLAVRLWVGKRKLYCSRFMLRQNWQDVQALRRWQPNAIWPLVITLVITALTLAAAIAGTPGAVIPLAVLAAGWVLARANEPRVFGLTLPWIATFILGGL